MVRRYYLISGARRGMVTVRPGRSRSQRNGEGERSFEVGEGRIGANFKNLHSNTSSIYGSEFFEGYCLRGIRVDRIEPGFVSCLFRVPPHLTDKDGNLSSGAIASLVDEVGFVAISADGLPLKVSVDMSISYISTAKLNDELEIVSRSLGHKGGYSGTSVLIKNKFTGEIIAEGRHSLFGRMSSKI